MPYIVAMEGETMNDTIRKARVWLKSGQLDEGIPLVEMNHVR